MARPLQRFTLVVWLTVFIAGISTVMSLTQEQIEQAVQAGLVAKKVKNVPAFIELGVGRGDFGHKLMTGYPGDRFSFLAQNCRMWISNQAFRTRLDDDELDREAIGSECLDRDRLIIAIVPQRAATPLMHYASESHPIPEKPVTDVWLKVGKEILRPASTERYKELGEGNALLVFDIVHAMEARPLHVVAEIGHEYELKIKVYSWARRKLFR